MPDSARHLLDTAANAERQLQHQLRNIEVNRAHIATAWREAVRAAYRKGYEAGFAEGRRAYHNRTGNPPVADVRVGEDSPTPSA